LQYETPQSGSAVSSSLASSSHPPDASFSSQNPHSPGSIQATIATALKVPPALMDRTKKRDIRLAYAKFEAVHDAIRTLNKMALAGTWNQKVPSNDDIIEVFCSRSVYFRYYKGIFSRVPEDTPVQKWLRNDEDAPSHLEIWGSMKPSLDNLQIVLDTVWGGDKGKKKEKERERGKEKEKGKGKEREKEKERGKGKAKKREREKEKEKGKGKRKRLLEKER